MINFQNANFIKSVAEYSFAPNDNLSEVLIVGKSNVGKSSLINALCNKKRLAFTSSKPGHTRLLNYFNIDNKFYLVDAPGYGYSKIGKDLDLIFSNMMEDYFQNSKKVKLVLILLDARREMSADDLEIISFLENSNIKYCVIITKIDKTTQSERALFKAYLKEQNINAQIFFTSAQNIKSLDPLKKEIEKSLFC